MMTTAELDFSTMSRDGNSSSSSGGGGGRERGRNSHVDSSDAAGGVTSEDDYFLSIARDGTVIKPIPVSEL